MGGFSNSGINASIRGYILRSLVKGRLFCCFVQFLCSHVFHVLQDALQFVTNLKEKFLVYMQQYCLQMIQKW